MAVTYETLEDFTAALAVLVPDMKGDYAEEDFIQEAVQRLSEDYPAFATVDIGNDTLKEWQLGATTFAAWSIGYSETWPFEVEELDADDTPFDEKVAYGETPRIDVRTVAGVPVHYLVFSSAPSVNAKARVRFRIPWAIGDTAAETTVPAKFHVAVVKLAAALKCAALSTFYKRSIDPAGGSDIFDARQYAESYATDADRWRAEYQQAVGGSSGGRIGFSHGKIAHRIPTVFRPWGS